MVLLFAFFGLLALVIVRAAPRGDAYEEKRAKARAEKLEAAQKENVAALTTYGWVDKTKGIARIPITDAMKLTVAELAQKKPAAANPIAMEAAAPAPAATNPTAPATSPVASTTPSPAATPTPKPISVSGPHSESHNQPAAATNPAPAPPNTQPGPSTTPAGSPPSAATKAQVSPTASPTPTAPGSPLPVRGKTP
jgi:hypothetical protein